MDSLDMCCSDSLQWRVGLMVNYSLYHTAAKDESLNYPPVWKSFVSQGHQHCGKFVCVDLICE